MELLNPKLTVQNTNAGLWLVSIDHAFSEHERLSVTLKMPKSDEPLAGLQRDTIAHLIDVLQQMNARL